MMRKDAPFFMLDTHAGIGNYNLDGAESVKTGEWRNGIGKLLAKKPRELSDYIDLICGLGLYPGSPSIARALIRPQDRMAVSELHPQDSISLRRRFGRDGRVQVHQRDGYEAIRALLPPHEKRALVLIDPPFERDDEFQKVMEALSDALTRMRGAVIAIWYPIKHRPPVREFFESIKLAGIKDTIAAELCLREPLDPSRLNGCGMLVANPPYRCEQDWPVMLAALLGALGDREPGERAEVIRVTDE